MLKNAKLKTKIKNVRSGSSASPLNQPDALVQEIPDKDDVSHESAGSQVVNEDKAMAPGGIDLNSDKLNLETRSSSGVIRFKVNPGQILEFQNAPGFTPVIINIQPMTSLPVFLGLRQDDSAFKKIGMR